LSYRSWALWFLGLPQAAVADTDWALRDARAIGQAASLMYALTHASLTQTFCGNYAIANAITDELVALASEKGTVFWKSQGMALHGQLSALTGKASRAIETITAGVAAYRSTGSTVWVPLYLASLARAYADLGKFDDAWRSIREATSAIETTMERWWEAEVHRTAGEIALRAPEPDTASRVALCTPASLKPLRARVSLNGAESPRAREPGADTPELGQQTDPRTATRSRRLGGGWSPSPLLFSFIPLGGGRWSSGVRGERLMMMLLAAAAGRAARLSHGVIANRRH